MNEFWEYMQRSEAEISGLSARVTALESVLVQMSGLTMESDPSKLPVVVVETSPGAVEVTSNGGN